MGWMRWTHASSCAMPPRSCARCVRGPAPSRRTSGSARARWRWRSRKRATRRRCCAVAWPSPQPRRAKRSNSPLARTGSVTPRPAARCPTSVCAAPIDTPHILMTPRLATRHPCALRVALVLRLAGHQDLPRKVLPHGARLDVGGTRLGVRHYDEGRARHLEPPHVALGNDALLVERRHERVSRRAPLCFVQSTRRPRA